MRRVVISAWKRYSALLLAASVCVILVGCPGKSKPPKQAAPKPPADEAAPRVNGVFRDYRIEYSEKGLWSAKVDTVTLDSDTRQLTMTGIACTLYQDGKEALHVSADSGTAVYADDETVQLHLFGPVKATSKVNQQRLHAEEFRWSSADGRVHVKNLRWLGNSFSARADRGIFSTDLQQSDLAGNVRFRMPGEE